MIDRFDGKVAIVTGAGSGIGRAAALAFAAESACVLAADLDRDAAEQTVKAIKEAGGRGKALACDVGNAVDVSAVVDEAVREFSRLDIMFNNAGINGPQETLLIDLDEDDFDRVVRVNLKGTWLGLKYAIPAMVRSGGGCIVNVASNMGLVSQKYLAPYAASKHGVIGLTKTAAIEFGQQGVRVNAICPGAIETPMLNSYIATYDPEAWRQRMQKSYPATGRMGRAEEVAATVLFLCSDAASNIHGVSLPIDGGYTAQ